MGISPIAYARESIGLGVAAEQFGSAFFKNGTHLGGVITVPGRLDDQAFERTSREFKSMYRGLQNAHGIPVIEGGATFQSVGIAPEDAQFLETRKYQRSEIAGLFRVPPHLIGDLEHATFSNIEHQDISYLQRSLLPWLTRIEQGMNNRLLTAGERSRYLIEHDTGGFMRGDTKSRYEAYAIGITNGIITRNEARVRENLNPIAGGDELLQPLNMTTVGANDAQSEPDGKRAFQLIDTRDFTSDRRRRAVMGKRDAASALGLKKRQIEALEKAFSAWLSRQSADIRKIIEAAFGQRAKTQWDTFNETVEAYFAALKKEALPKDIRAATEDVARTAIRRIREELGDEAARIDAAWIRKYLEIYYADERERLLDANMSAVKKLAKGGAQEDVEKLIEKLGAWKQDRAASMARIEAAMALNEALVAGYGASGYFAQWQSAPGCCKICVALNGRTVTTLKPPLHKGCVCMVKRGEKRLTAEGGSGSIKYNHNADGTIVVTEDRTGRREDLPLKYKAGSVVQTKGSGGQINRTYYGCEPDENGEAPIVLQIHSRAHGCRKKPDYKNGGMHAHDMVNGDRLKYSSDLDGRDVTRQELEENKDLL